MTLRAEATQILSELVGKPADFHDGQFEAIEAIVEGRRGLVVQRTGWGKSAVYFVATALLRRRGGGPTLIISPLLALMADQVSAAQRAGIVAESMNSTNAASWDAIAERLARDEIDVLLISPERLNNPMFRQTQLPDLIERLGLLVIDEAHCISDWGHDFRPDYRRIGAVISQLDTPILATTATANQRVVDDVVEQLGDDVFLTRGPLARSSLRLSVLPQADSQTRIGWLVDHLAHFESSGIIYTLTVAAAHDVAEALQAAGHNVAAYTGATAPEERTELEQALKDNQVKALIATSALGMGFDKPDLGFVVHFGAPSSPVSYYQHIGRAGRGTDHAEAVLLPGVEDERIWDYFATASMPDKEIANQVLEATTPKPLSVPALSARVDLSASRLELLIKILAVDDAIVRVQGGWQATGTPWHYDAKRYEHVAAQRVAEQNLMLEYQHTAQCRMQFLSQTLDDPYAQACGRCDNCAGSWLTLDISDDARSHAQQVLSRPGVDIAPRRMWPTGLDNLGMNLKGKIKSQHEPGRALARLTDLGWGPTLRQVEAAPDQPVTDAMVQGLVQVLADWNWAQRPIAVVAMPSPNRPQLVSSLAQAIASIGQLPYLGELQWNGPVPTPAANSAFRLAQVHNRYTVPAQLQNALDKAPQGPILLVDDIVSTRWSLTVASVALLEAGADGVLPLTLGIA